MKIFIVANNCRIDDANTVARYISNRYDMDIANRFSSQDNYDISNITIAFKNNAVLSCYIDSFDNMFGIMMEDFYNSDIMCMNIEEFNSISEAKLTDILILWIDSKYENITRKDLAELDVFQKALDSFNYMYFNESTNTIIETLDKYFNADDDEKLRIIEENN